MQATQNTVHTSPAGRQVLADAARHLLEAEFTDALYAAPPGHVSTPADDGRDTVPLTRAFAELLCTHPGLALQCVYMLVNAANSLDDTVAAPAVRLIDEAARAFATSHTARLEAQGAFDAA